MIFLSGALCVMSLCGVIGFAVYWTDSATPLWALLLAPCVIPDMERNRPNKKEGA